MSNSSNISNELRDKVAVVTGAAQGLGLGVATELARRGAIIADLQEEKARQAAERLSGEGHSAKAASINVTDSAAVNRCLDDVVGAHGRLDIMVNSAGIGQKVTPVVNLDDEEWRRVIDCTLTGTFYCCRAAARHMEKQEAGSIVNFASINGQSPAALVASYNVAKAGVIMLTQTLALELAAYGVRVNAVSPGPVYTEFNRTVMAHRCESLGLTEEQMIEKVRCAIPLGRWGEPEDIANVVAFLCGPGSGWMTGEVIRVSGGMVGVSATPPKRAEN